MPNDQNRVWLQTKTGEVEELLEIGVVSNIDVLWTLVHLHLAVLRLSLTARSQHMPLPLSLTSKLTLGVQNGRKSYD